MKRTLAILSIMLASAGCSSRSVRVAMRPPADYRGGPSVSGSACGLLLWGIIPAGCNSRTERAYQSALAGRGSSLTDTEIQYSWYTIPFLGYWLCTAVQGRVVP